MFKEHDDEIKKVSEAANQSVRLLQDVVNQKE